MCGRFVSSLPPDRLRVVFGTAGPLPNIQPNWNVAPTQDAPVVRRHPDTGDRHLSVLRWGLVPGWTKDFPSAPKPINARSETAAGSGMFKGALALRRCIVPADAFYEWRTAPDGKQPYAVARCDGAPMALAGLWEGWRDPAGEVLRTFTVLTTAANAVMRTLHQRMPVILEPCDWPAWLGETPGDPAALLRPAADDILRVWPVSRAVNNVRHNGAALLDRIDDPLAPPPSAAPPGANPA